MTHTVMLSKRYTEAQAGFLLHASSGALRWVPEVLMPVMSREPIHQR
jgi:hypothetical protein